MCLALEADAFGVKEPVAGQPEAENKHFFFNIWLHFLGSFSSKIRTRKKQFKSW